MWLYLFLPVILLSGIAVYFNKKSGATAPEEEQLRGKIVEYPPENYHSNGPSNF